MSPTSGPQSSLEAHAITVDLAPIRRALHSVLLRLQVEAGAVAAVGFVDPHHAEGSEMTPARHAEFESGRVAAARALRQAGWEGNCAVASDARGVPLFPRGFVGSIAHKHGRAIAAIAKASTTSGLGVDLEFDQGLHDAALAEEVVTNAEVPQLAVLRAEHPSLASIATLVLAAKEAVFKAVFPITRTDFTFGDAEVAFDGKARSFRAVHFPGHEVIEVHGTYEVDERWIVVAVVANARCAHSDV